MEATVATRVSSMNVKEILMSLIVSEVDLGYDRRQNVLLSCNVDGCNRISYCSCDCNDSSW